MKPSIEDLEGVIWAEPQFSSAVVLAGHALRKKPIDQLTPNDLRVAFNEDIGTAFLKERVVEILSADPATGHLFEGDLILAVMRSRSFRSDEAFRKKIIELAVGALEAELDAETRREIAEKIKPNKPVGQPGPLHGPGV